MSFGLDILTHDVDGNELWIEVVDGHTYNLTPMWLKALPTVLDRSTSELHDRKCSDLRADLVHGVIHITKYANEYRAMNPDNGWGDFEGFREIFCRFAELVLKHPSGVVKWNG